VAPQSSPSPSAGQRQLGIGSAWGTMHLGGRHRQVLRLCQWWQLHVRLALLRLTCMLMSRRKCRCQCQLLRL
jgi:hypothetical protein